MQLDLLVQMTLTLCIAVVVTVLHMTMWLPHVTAVPCVLFLIDKQGIMTENESAKIIGVTLQVSTSSLGSTSSSAPAPFLFTGTTSRLPEQASVKCLQEIDFGFMLSMCAACTDQHTSDTKSHSTAYGSWAYSQHSY